MQLKQNYRIVEDLYVTFISAKAYGGAFKKLGQPGNIEIYQG